MPCTFVEEAVLHVGLRGNLSNRAIIIIIIIINIIIEFLTSQL
jgi:hypothetical protein